MGGVGLPAPLPPQTRIDCVQSIQPVLAGKEPFDLKKLIKVQVVTRSFT